MIPLQKQPPAGAPGRETSPPPDGRDSFPLFANYFLRSCNPPHQLRRASRNEFPAATPAPKRVPRRTGETRFHYLPSFLRSCNPPHQLRRASRNEFPAATPPRNESPAGRERLVSTICQLFCVAAIPHISYDALPETSSPQLRQPRNESPRHAFGYAGRRRSNPPALTLPHLAKLHPAGILSTPVSADCAKSFVCVPRNWERGGYG